MPTKQQTQAMHTYAAIMEEIKVRISTVQKIAQNRDSHPGLIVNEMCYLQFRMMCELISLACLVAHGDITEVSAARFQTAYQADFIANALQKLHSDFFPTPFKQVMRSDISFHCDLIDGPYLTKDGLVALNHACGGTLHRGSLKKLLKPKNPLQLSFPDIQEKLQLIVSLLDKHYIKLIDGSTLLCILEPTGPGRVQVAFTEQLLDGQLPPGAQSFDPSA